MNFYSLVVELKAMGVGGTHRCCSWGTNGGCVSQLASGMAVTTTLPKTTIYVNDNMTRKRIMTHDGLGVDACS